MARTLVTTTEPPTYVGPLVGQAYEPILDQSVEAAQVAAGDVLYIYDGNGGVILEVRHPDYWVRPDPTNPDNVISMPQSDFESTYRLTP